jgi:hypothetical protein
MSGNRLLYNHIKNGIFILLRIIPYKIFIAQMIFISQKAITSVSTTTYSARRQASMSLPLAATTASNTMATTSPLMSISLSEDIHPPSEYRFHHTALWRIAPIFPESILQNLK